MGVLGGHDTRSINGLYRIGTTRIRASCASSPSLVHRCASFVQLVLGLRCPRPHHPAMLVHPCSNFFV